MLTAKEIKAELRGYFKRVRLGEKRAGIVRKINELKSSDDPRDEQRLKETLRELRKLDKQNPRICCQQEINAVKRYHDDVKRADEKGFAFNEQLATWAINFFSLMRITQGEHAGKPFKLYPWQKFIVWNLAGWYWAGTKNRRFQEALIQVGRGNGKTPFGAGLLLLFGFFIPGCVKRGNNYVTATKRDQAKIAFGDIEAILAACPDIEEKCNPLTNKITCLENKNTIEAVSSDGKTADGWRILTLLRDEYHAWDSTNKINQFDAKLKTALGKFDSSLAITITTAGSETSTKWIAYDKLARMVVAPESEVNLESFFVAIFELEADDDLFEIENYHKSNPMLEHGIVKKRHLENWITKGRVSPDDKQELERFHANRRVSSSSKPFNPVIWSAGNQEIDVTGYLPTGGLDLGAADDLASLAAVWKLPGEMIRSEDGTKFERFRWYAEVDVWLPSGGRRDLTEEPWSTWVNNGWLRITQSEWTDFNEIQKRILERRDLHGWHSIAVDKWQARQIGINLTNENIEVFQFEQSNRRFNEPCREFEQAVFEERFFHEPNPLLEWCACNYVTVQDSNEHKRPDKLMSEEKIDPVVSIIMGVSEAMFSEPVRVSKYEHEGVEPAFFGIDDSGQVVDDDLAGALEDSLYDF